MRATGAVRLRTETPTKPPYPKASGGFIIQHLLPAGTRRACTAGEMESRLAVAAPPPAAAGRKRLWAGLGWEGADEGLPRRGRSGRASGGAAAPDEPGASSAGPSAAALATPPSVGGCGGDGAHEGLRGTGGRTADRHRNRVRTAAGATGYWLATGLDSGSRVPAAGGGGGGESSMDTDGTMGGGEHLGRP